MTNKVSYLFVGKEKFVGVAKKVGKATRGVRKAFKGLKKDSDNVRKSVARTSGQLAGNLKNLAAAALSFVGIRKFLETGAKFQDAMADLSAITGAAGEDLDNLRVKTLKMAKASVTSQAEVAEAIKLVASAKPDLLENLDALTATTKEVLLLKNAAGIELADAANITAQGLNIFGAEAKRAGEFVNILAAGAKLGSSEIADTGQAMLIAGPGAKAAGLSFGQLNAAIQSVAKSGIKGSQAGTALNAIFGRLRRRGTDFKKVGLEKAFADVRDELERIKNPTKRAQMEAKIFGEEHAKVGLALLDNAKLLGQYEKSLVGTNIAQEQADIRLATFNSKMKKLGVIFNDFLIKAFVKLEPMITKQVESLSQFFDQIEPKQVDGFVESLKGLVMVASLIIDTFKVVASVFKGIGTAIGELVGQFATLDFSASTATSMLDAFSIGGKLLGIFEPAKAEGKKAAKEMQESQIKSGMEAAQQSRTDINVNLRAPEGAVQAVKTQTTGRVSGLNVGVNMATAQ